VKRHGGSYLSRQKQLQSIQLAQKRKQELAVKLLRSNLASDRDVQPAWRPSVEARERAPAEALRKQQKVLPPVEPASFGMKLWADDTSVQLRTVTAVDQFAGRLVQAAESHTTSVLLLWPGSLRSLGLAHAVACASRWRQGDKQGIRTLIYPAKANFLHALNHAHLDRTNLVDLAQDLYEDPGALNASVRVSLREKDPFWLALNCITPEAEGNIHPSLAELIPHFFADKGFAEWRACDGDLLRHVKAKLKEPSHRRLLNDLTIPKLSEPDSAPDALFAISWKASQEDIQRALRKLKRGRQPDVVIIDATRSLRKDNPAWKSGIIRFIECAQKAWLNDMPPVLVVTDEPHTRNQLIQELNKRSAKGSEASRWLLDSGLPTEGAICTVARDGVILQAASEPLTPSPRNIQVAITDTEAAELVASIDRLRNCITDPRWTQILESAAAYLARLASLPSSTAVLTRWLNEADVPMAVRGNYAWPVYRSELESILHDPTFGRSSSLKKVIDRGDALWANYENGTPLARKLANLIEEHTRGLEKCCVVFTRPTARRLAERYFETYDGYPEGAGFEVLRDCVRFIVSRNLDAEVQSGSAETLVFAGLDEDSLRFLLLDDRVSSPTYVLLTRRNAAYLKATLRSIRSTSGFANLAPRVDALLSQLPDFPDLNEGSILSREDFVLPTFSFEQSLSATGVEHEDSDPNSWELRMDNGIHVRRSPSSRVYLFDPALSHTPTRGFRSTLTSQLREGDRLFIMSFELRELTEAALKDAGIQISNDKDFESQLRLYHQRVGERVLALGGFPLKEKVKLIVDRMRDLLDAKCQMPTESTVRSWMDVERFRGVTFENAKPSAPRDEAHYRAFAAAIGLADFEAIYFWKAVIRPLRGIRRADGRRVTDAYTELLLDQESSIVHRRIKPGVVQMLFARARENIHVIETIRTPFGGSQNE